MPITLTDADLMELQKLIDELRHKDAIGIIRFFQMKQKQSADESKLPLSNGANGHAEEARA